MKNLTRFFVFAVVGIFYTACESNSETVIRGTADNIDDLVFMDVGGEAPDTLGKVAVSGDGSFSFDLQIDSLTLVLVSPNERYRIPLFVEPGQQVELEIDADQENPSYEVSGSPESERIRRITAILDKTMDKVDSLNALVQEAQGTEGFTEKRQELDAAFQREVENAKKQYKSMIDEQPGSIANIFIFSQALGNFRIVSPEEDFEYFEKVANAIQKEHPNSTIAQNFVGSVGNIKQQLAQQKQMEEVQQNLAPGSEIPEISLPNPDGETMNLSELRGKVVLVDFWAAWCGPCRRENPNLVRLYDRYNDQGFEIFSVSLDGLPKQQNPKQAWVTAIEQDNLSWDYHVSDLKGWRSSVVPKFGLRGIPFTVLIDREGKVIATKLRGPQLEAKLAEVLGAS